MFEVLGYKLVSNDDVMVYTNRHVHWVYIDTKHKEYWSGNDTFIDLRIHEAITQQMKELGWILVDNSKN